MNKNDLIDSIAKTASLPKQKSEKAFDAVIDIITDTLRREKRVRLTGFGSFYTVKKELPPQNPPPKKPLKKKKLKKRQYKKIPAFSPGKTLKEAVRK